MSKRTIRIDQFPAELQRLIAVLIPTLGHELAMAVMLYLHRNIVKASPVGDPRVDQHPGKYRASHTVSAGRPVFRDLPDQPSYPIPGDPEAIAGMRQSKPGQDLFVATDARSDGAERGYSGFLEGGRRQYSRVSTQMAMWIGSEQASEGVYEPSVATTAGQRDTIASAAIRQTEKRLGA